MAEPTIQSGSVDPREVDKFSALAEEWWDPDGDLKPLHDLSPLRLQFIRDQIASHVHRCPDGPGVLEGIRIADVGCGGGLLCEPLSRLGARVTGIDASARNVTIAARHAAAMGLAIDYQQASAEQLAATGASYDAVLAMEIVEHVADLDIFITACCALVKPDGLLIVATLNRTAKAFLLAIVGAEYLLRWLPRGSHDWRKFLRPSELAAQLRGQGLTLREAVGVTYNPLADRWRYAKRDLDVNYMVAATKDPVRRTGRRTG